MSLRSVLRIIPIFTLAIVWPGHAHATRHHHIVAAIDQHAVSLAGETQEALRKYAPDVDIVYGAQGRAQPRGEGAVIFDAVPASAWASGADNPETQHSPWGLNDLRQDIAGLSAEFSPPEHPVQKNHGVICTLDQAEQYARGWAENLDAIFVDVGPYQRDALRPDAVERLKPIADHIKKANKDCWFGIVMSTSPEHLDAHQENGAQSALKLFADTAFWTNAYMIPVTPYDTLPPDNTNHRPYFAQVMEGIANWDARPEDGMYAETFRPPDTELNRTSEVWMQRSAMVLGVFTILGAIFVTYRFKPRQAS